MSSENKQQRVELFEALKPMAIEMISQKEKPSAEELKKKCLEILELIGDDPDKMTSFFYFLFAFLNDTGEEIEAYGMRFSFTFEYTDDEVKGNRVTGSALGSKGKLAEMLISVIMQIC